ncbi:MAG: hypothetical protein ACO1TE_28540 [Prosthecobacter sp.]
MASEPQLSKKDRVDLILTRLLTAPAAGSREEALALMDRVFREVEDMHSGVPHDPYHPDRLYPPTTDMERKVEGRPSLSRYRHTGHYTLIAENGAIEVRILVRGMKDGVKVIVGERTELNKAGADGRRVADFD